MILVVDIGNSHIVVGGAEKHQILFESRLRTNSAKTADEYAIDLKMLLEVYHRDASQVEGAIIASVVPQTLNAVRSAIKKLTGKNSLIVGPGIKTGLNIKIDNPAQTGADLVVGSVAALKLYQPPLIVVDMDTATTMSVLDEKGVLIGGAICPGVRISLDALTEHAALLPGIQLEPPKRVIGRNTTECMRSGILYGAAAMLDGLISRMEAELGQETTVVVTGRPGEIIAPLCQKAVHYEKNLTLQGLAWLYRENTK